MEFLLVSFILGILGISYCTFFFVVSLYFVSIDLGSGISAFSYNEYTVPRWEAAKQDYETKMAPVEKLVADKLRASLTRGNTNPGQARCLLAKGLEDRKPNTMP